MQVVSLADRLAGARLGLFAWRNQLATAQKVALALAWAGLIGLSAQVRVPMFPVPMTLQTLPVLLAGILLGGRWGAVSVVFYIALGIAGIPWFATGTGLAALAGPTGGYLIGFILAAWLLGSVSDRHAPARHFLPMLGLMLLATFAIIYGLGLAQLGLWLHLVKGTDVSLGQLLATGALPFVVGDLLKIAVAAGVVKAVTPKE